MCHIITSQPQNHRTPISPHSHNYVTTFFRISILRISIHYNFFLTNYPFLKPLPIRPQLQPILYLLQHNHQVMVSVFGFVQDVEPVVITSTKIPNKKIDMGINLIWVKYVCSPPKYLKFCFQSLKIFPSKNDPPKKSHPHFWSLILKSPLKISLIQSLSNKISLKSSLILSLSCKNCC